MFKKIKDRFFKEEMLKLEKQHKLNMFEYQRKIEIIKDRIEIEKHIKESENDYSKDFIVQLLRYIEIVGNTNKLTEWKFLESKDIVIILQKKLLNGVKDANLEDIIMDLTYPSEDNEANKYLWCPDTRVLTKDAWFSDRVYNILYQRDFLYLEDIAVKTETHLSSIRLLGKKAVNEIKEVLKNYWYTLKEL